MTNELTLTIPKSKIGELESVVGQCNLQVISSYGSFQQAFLMAAGIRSIEKLITGEMMQDIVALQNTPLGFLTDKPAGYPLPDVKRFFIEAIMRGVRPVGNEFNIIAGKVYITKEGFARLVREYRGLTDLKLSPEVPCLAKGGALVKFKAEWLLDGECQQMEREIPVKVNQGMGTDAILGKATRKILAAVYGQLVGSDHAVPEGEVGDAYAVATAHRRSELTDKLPPEANPDAEPDNEVGEL